MLVNQGVIVKEILVVAVLFIVSIGFNALIARYSTKKVLGIEMSFFKSSLVVIGRTLAALLAGFCVGYGVKVAFASEVDMKWVQLTGLLLMTGLSFVAYWILLGKVTQTKIPFVGMAKTAIAETGLTIVSIIGVSVIISILLVLFNLQPVQ